MGDLRSKAVMAVLTAAFLILGVAAAVALPPGFVGGGTSATLAYVPPGQLAISVWMNNGSGLDTPVAGGQVRVSQTIVHGIILLAHTNDSGEVEMTLASGQYAVSVFDQRFSFGTGVSVNPGKVTQLQVQVNRTSFLAFWVEAQDSSTTGQVETWNQLEVAVSVPGSDYLAIGGPVLVTVPVGQSENNSNFKFPAGVFLQPIEYQFGGTFEPRGPEIPAAVISQVTSSGNAWLVLRLLTPLTLSGANYLVVVVYEAGGTATVPGA